MLWWTDTNMSLGSVFLVTLTLNLSSCQEMLMEVISLNLDPLCSIQSWGPQLPTLEITQALLFMRLMKKLCYLLISQLITSTSRRLTLANQNGKFITIFWKLTKWRMLLQTASMSSQRKCLTMSNLHWITSTGIQKEVQMVTEPLVMPTAERTFIVILPLTLMKTDLLVVRVFPLQLKPNLKD